MRALAIAVLLAACGGEDDGGRNPILADDQLAIKDAYVVHDGDTWRLGYSRITADPFRFVLGFAAGPDLGSLVEGDPIDQPETGGLASPTVVRAPDGRWVMTYNSHTTDVDGAASKLYYRTSKDLQTWSDPTRIHITDLDAPGDRLIDAAVAFTADGAFLFFKREQTASLAYAASGSIDGPWALLGALVPNNLENYQPIFVDSTWHLLATTLPFDHAPAWHDLAGDPHDPMAWLTWTPVRTFDIPEQPWNSGEDYDHERANAAFLLDDRDRGGTFDLIYAGSTDLASYNGRGHAMLGLARSTDLVTWEAAPPR